MHYPIVTNHNVTLNIIMFGHSWKGANVLKSFASLVMIENYIQYHDILWSMIIVLYVVHLLYLATNCTSNTNASELL